MKNAELSIVACQISSRVGNISHNKQRILEMREMHKGADLVVFPECFLTGYPLEDLALRPGFIQSAWRALMDIAEHVRENTGPALLIGTPFMGTELPYNAAVLIRPDGSMGIATKSELPNHDVFDEVRVFARNSGPVAPLRLGDWKIGVAICEDIWHDRVPRELAGALSDVIIAINGSPFESNKIRTRLSHVSYRAKQANLPILYLNLVGGQDEIVFDGGSFSVNSKGIQVSQAPFFEEAIVNYKLVRQGLETELLPGSIAVKPLYGHYTDFIPDDSSLFSHNPYSKEAFYSQIWDAAVLGLRDYVNNTGHNKVHIGLSGGLDSSVVAVMAVDALGSDRVIGVSMPSRQTSEESKQLARDLASNLGISFQEISIDDGFQKILDVLDEFASDAHNNWRRVAYENGQSRERGQVLMALSNALGTLVLSTGNKSEMSVGYATLYGDMNGGFNPVKDIYKTTLFGLADWRNRHKPGEACISKPIPERVITRKPTAELSDNQSDEDSLGSYPALDAVLYQLIERNMDRDGALIEARKETGEDISEEYVNKIAGMLLRSEYKRRQAPPGVKLTGRSLSRGWRYPIVNAYPF